MLIRCANHAQCMISFFSNAEVAFGFPQARSGAKRALTGEMPAFLGTRTGHQTKVTGERAAPSTSP